MTTSFRERVHRVQEWVGIHHEDYPFQPNRSRTCEHSASGGNGFGKSTRHNSRIIHCSVVICENCTQHCPSTPEIQQCVCTVGTKIRDGRHKNWCLEVCFHVKSFKGGPNGFPESIVMLWDMGSQFYSKWALMQWIHPSSLRTTKCKGCQYAGRLWHLYSMLQESSALYSYFDIQKWIWIYAVKCCVDCIRLLAGRGMYICHKVWTLSTVMQPHTVYNENKDLLQSCCWKLKENPTYGADLALWNIIFGPLTQHLWAHQFYSKKNSGA